MGLAESAEHLSKALISELDRGSKIDWDGPHRRISGFLLRAAVDAVHCQQLLASIHTTRVRPSKHGDLFKAFREFSMGRSENLEKHDEWPLWMISSLISDSQHRIAATFDRCIGRWLLGFAFNEEIPEDERKVKHGYIEERLYPWIGSRLLTLALLLTNASNNIRTPTQPSDTIASDRFSTVCDESLSLVTKIIAALPIADTASAATKIRSAQHELFKQLTPVERLEGHFSVIEIAAKLRHETGAPLTAEECLAITMGRVNDFKHRATSPKITGEFTDESKPYMRHVELATTVQALGVAIRFFKCMAAYIENAPRADQGAVTLVQSALFSADTASISR